MMGFFETLDHEASLLAAVSLLILFSYLTYLFCAMLWTLMVTRSCPSPTSYANGKVITSLALLFLACELPSIFMTPNEGLLDLIQGQDPKLNEILSRIPALQQGPSPPLLFRNRHIQFIPWMIQNEIHRQQGIPFDRIEIDVTDCRNKIHNCHDDDYYGQQQYDMHNTMNDTITLDVFPSFDDTAPYAQGFNKSSPIILFAPGLRCYSQDMPGNMIIRKAYDMGFRSVVINRRGHTPNQVLKSPRWNLFGDVDDTEQVYWYIKDQLATSDTPFFLHGISSGTATTVTGLSKWDKRRREQPERRTPAFVASVAITPGYDISKVMTRERFQWPYNDILLGGVKDTFVKQHEEILRSHDSDAVDHILAATSLQEIVDRAVMFAGYDNATLYYEETNPINEVRDITTPKLVLNSRDDPCCHIANLYEQSPYPRHDGKTFADMIRETQHSLVAVTHTGSHCPFICSRNRWLPLVKDPLMGGWMLNSWADQVSVEYYRATLDVYNERRYL